MILEVLWGDTWKYCGVILGGIVVILGSIVAIPGIAEVLFRKKILLSRILISEITKFTSRVVNLATAVRSCFIGEQTRLPKKSALRICKRPRHGFY